MTLRSITIAAAVASLAACLLVYSLVLRPGGDRRSAASDPAVGSPRAADEPLPAPTGTPVVRISGVENGNVGRRTTKLDLATLDRIGVERLTVREPFVGRDITFSGISMQGQGAPPGQALDRMTQRPRRYDPALLDALRDVLGLR